MEPKDVLNLLQAAPKLRPLVMRWARMAARGERLPATFSAADLGYDDQQSLERFLHVTTSRTRSGRVLGTVPEEMRDPAAWRMVQEALGLAENNTAEPTSDFLSRIRWQMPDAREAIAEFKDMPEVLRDLADAANRPAWRELFASAWDRTQSRPVRATTLSQLGSDWFNDSKVLRSGALRRQLVLILSAIYGVSADDERSVLAEAGIEENPYTSSVVVSAPFTFRLKDGTRFDYPMKFFMKRLKGIPLTPSQTARIDRFLTLHPDFKYADSVRLIRERGCWYEQEGFRPVRQLLPI